MTEMSTGILLPYQNAWINDDAQVKVYQKSRRIGVSWGTACEAVLTASAQDGMDVWYVGYNREMAQEFIRDSADWAKKLGIVAEHVNETVVENEDADILNYGIKFASGKRITALSSKPSNLRGKQGYVIIDEAAFHEQLDELIKAAMALLMWGGKVAIISTHDGVDNPFNQLVEDIRADRKPYSLHTTTFKQALKQGLYRRICQMRGITWTQRLEFDWIQELYDFYGDDSAEELDVIPSNSGGAAISRALLEQRAVDAPLIRLEKSDAFVELPEHLRRVEVADWCGEMLLPILETLDDIPHTLGSDFARSGDLSVFAPFGIQPNLRRVAPFIVELKNIPHKQQEQILFYILDRLPKLQAVWMDATGNGEYLAESTRDKYGSLVEQVKLNNAWYSEHMPKFKAAFEDDTIAIVKHSDVIDDHRALQVIDGIIKLPKGKTGKNKDRHGDSAIACALGYSASFTDCYAYEYEPIEAIQNPFKRGF